MKEERYEQLLGADRLDGAQEELQPRGNPEGPAAPAAEGHTALGGVTELRHAGTALTQRMERLEERIFSED